MADGSQLTLPQGGHHSAPDEVWARVRDDYLAGMSAPEACRRYGVSLTSLRNRAASEGWRRADQPWRPPNRLDPQDEGLALEDRTGGDLDRIEMRELSFVAHRRMMRAVLRGDAAEALRWRRVSLAMDEEEAVVERWLVHEEALRIERADHAELAAPLAGETGCQRISTGPDGVDGVDGPDGVDGVFP